MPSIETVVYSCDETMEWMTPPISNKYFYSQINKSMNKEHEPLLNINPKRFVLFPIQHDDVRCSTCVCVSIVIL